MQDYRLYYLDMAGHILRCDAIEVEGDTDAVAEARLASKSHDIEIWQGARLVAKVDKQQPASRGRSN